MPVAKIASSRAAISFPLIRLRQKGGKRGRRDPLLLVIIVATTFYMVSCGPPSIDQPSPGRPWHESRSVDVGGARSVHAEILMGAGNLNVSGGADALMEGDFSYGLDDWEPEISYDVSGTEGELTVEQGRGEVPIGREVRNDWNVRLTEEVPTDLLVEMGAGRSNLDLRELNLTGLDLEGGAGRAVLDLSGDYTKDLDASIEGGVGELAVRLPGEVGVRVNIEGLGRTDAQCLRKEGGAYVNNAYGESNATLNVDIEGGIGFIKLKGSECP